MDEEFLFYDKDNRRLDDRFFFRGVWYGGRGWDRGRRGGSRGDFVGRGGMYYGFRGLFFFRDMDDRNFDNRFLEFMNKLRFFMRFFFNMKDFRWVNFSNFFRFDDIEEFVIDGKFFYIKVGVFLRKVRFGKGQIEIFVDFNQRCIFVDGQKVYIFGDYVREVKLLGEGIGRIFKVFYYGVVR